MKVTVQVFAALKDFFASEFVLEIEKDASVSLLVEKLSALNPGSQAVLSKCRIAINEKFVSNQYVVKDEERIFIVPPSSGG